MSRMFVHAAAQQLYPYTGHETRCMHWNAPELLEAVRHLIPGLGFGKTK